MSNFRDKLYLIVNFGEIFLKGKNIGLFEKRLLNNLNNKLTDFEKKIIFEKKSGGSFHIKITESLSEGDILKIEEVVKDTPGIVNFYRAWKVETDLEMISKTAVFLAKQTLKKANSYNSYETFGVKAERVEKEAKYSSLELGREVGSAVWTAFEENKLKVNLNNPDLKIYIKEWKRNTFVYTNVKKAVGGMPVGTSGRAITFLSGGIDSPVATFMGIKRGLEVTAIHFHAVPKTNPKSIEKVEELVKRLEKYQPNIKLILISILELQKEIKENCDERLRLVLLRRAMFKIGEEIAKKEFKENETYTFITGDSLAQVASQTLENLTVVGAVTNKLIIRPLVGWDKSEIMNKAREIDTYDISIKPHDDACSLFVPKSPETKAKLEYTEKEERKYDFKKIMEDILK